MFKMNWLETRGALSSQRSGAHLNSFDAISGIKLIIIPWSIKPKSQMFRCRCNQHAGYYTFICWRYETLQLTFLQDFFVCLHRFHGIHGRSTKLSQTLLSSQCFRWFCSLPPRTNPYLSHLFHLMLKISNVCCQTHSFREWFWIWGGWKRIFCLFEEFLSM